MTSSPMLSMYSFSSDRMPNAHRSGILLFCTLLGAFLFASPVFADAENDAAQIKYRQLMAQIVSGRQVASRTTNQTENGTLSA